MAKKSLKIDDKLADHLKHAEQNLIAAVTLFLDDPQLTRRQGYFARLVRAQEVITGLYREELVRMRGSKGGKRR